MNVVSRVSIVFSMLLAGCALPGSRAVVAPLASAAEQGLLEFTDGSAWQWATEDGVGCLELFGTSHYQPPHRSPLAMALVRDAEFGDFTMRVKARQTGREYPHRDLVFVFAYRDADHFAYAHLATKGDENAHHVMLVDGADRRPVTTARTEGVAWGDGWHDIELRREGTLVRVFFDGVGPVLRAEVPQGAGRVGVGSFDDTGRFRDLHVIRS
jgi:hypothetical protein